MLPKNNRLNLSKDFKWVASGRALNTKYAKLFIKSGENQEPKIGVAVATKMFKKAVDRNRAKRSMFAAFQSILSQLPKDLNIVALPNVSILEVKSEVIASTLAIIFKNEDHIN